MSSVAEGDCPAEAEDKLPREVWVLIAANAVIALGYGVVAPVLPQFARNFGVSISAATFVITAFAVMRLCFAPLRRACWSSGWGGAAHLRQRPADRGAINRCVRVRSHVLAAVGVPGARRNRLDDVLRLRAGIDDPDQPAHARGRVAGMFSSAFLVGSVAGPLLGSLTVGLGLAAPFVIYGAALLIAAAVVFINLRHSHLAAPAPAENLR